MQYFEVFKNVLLMEADSISEAAKRLKPEVVEKLVPMFHKLQDNNGQLFFCGVGKSGLIAQKLASTFSSLGLKSHFLHPVEALHGDLGRLDNNDAIVYLSKSGTTEELIKLDPYITITEDRKIGLIGNTDSVLAQKVGILLDCSVAAEACLNNQAPTTSSTLALAMGDAIAVVYEKFKDLSKEDFAYNHPGGILGKSLRYKVMDLAWKKDDCAVVSENATIKEVILEMTKKNIGACAIMNANEKLVGIMVEGDIRRTFNNEAYGLQTVVSEVMTKNPIIIGPEALAYDALKLMQERKNQISILPVIENDKFLGFIRIHDLLKEGFNH